MSWQSAGHSVESVLSLHPKTVQVRETPLLRVLGANNAFLAARRRKIDDQQVPCAVLIEGEDKPGGAQGAGSQQVTQSYVLGGYAECDPDHPNDRAHEILADIFEATAARVPDKARKAVRTASAMPCSISTSAASAPSG